MTTTATATATQKKKTPIIKNTPTNMSIVFSDKTMAILHNFQAINGNITFQKGNILRTTSPSHDIFAVCEIEENIPFDCSIYDLKEFMTILKITNAQDKSVPVDVLFNKRDMLLSSKNTSVKYRYCDPESCEPVPKGINMPETECTISLSSDEINQMKMTAAVLGHDHCGVSCDGDGNVKLSLFNIDDPMDNPWTMGISDANIDKGISFKFVLNIGSINIINDDYDIGFSSKGITEWVSKSMKMKYWVLINTKESFWKGK